MLRAVFALLFLASAVVLSQDATKPDAADPIAKDLAKAKQVFREEADKARQELMDAFEAEIRKIARDTTLTQKEVLKRAEPLIAERKAFADDFTKLPKAMAMKSHAADYAKAMAAHKKLCEESYEAAVRLYDDEKNPTAAKAVLVELDAFKKELAAGRFDSGDPFKAGGAGHYYRIVNRNSGKALDVAGKDSGARIVQRTVDREWKSQEWEFAIVDLRTKTAMLKNRGTGMAINIPRGDKRQGVRLIQWAAERTENELWQVEAVDTCFAFKSKLSGHFLAVAGGNLQDDADVIQWSWTKGREQHWKFIKLDRIK